MKHIFSLFSLACLVILGAPLPLPGIAGEPSHSAAATPWKISAELEEACSCHPACPCWFKSLPSRMTCDGAQAVFIQKGRYGKIHLEGLAVAAFVQSPEGKSMFESFGKWNLENVYIDERADENQRQALKEIAAHLFPAGAPKREFHFVPITREIAGPEHSITVGQVGSFSGHLLEGGFAGTPKIVNPPLADPVHREFLQGQTTRLVYNEAGQGWKYEHSNYMFTRCKVDSKQFEKYETELAKKMAAMKAESEK